MKKQLHLFIYSILLYLIMLSACTSNEAANSDTVKPSEIYQSYSVTYNSDGNELSATASFRVGGSTGNSLKLTNPSKVMLNNREMEANANNLAGTYYKINQQAPTLPPEFIFTYINNDNNISTNTGSIDEIEINSYPPVIYKNKGFEVTWTGKPVQEGETITATLDGKNFLSCAQSTSVAGEQSIHFRCDQLKGIKPGKANIVVTRSKNLFLKDAADPEGSFSLEYISKKVETLIQ